MGIPLRGVRWVCPLRGFIGVSLAGKWYVPFGVCVYSEESLEVDKTMWKGRI
jgi:hypothetical protein